MQTKDIKVGAEYTYVQYRGATPMRVKVLETGVSHPYGYRRTIKNGVRVEYVNTVRPAAGTERVVTTRQIGELWTDWEPKRDAQREAATIRHQARVDEANGRWARIKYLDEFFTEQGAPEIRNSVYGTIDTNAAQRAGFSVDVKGVVVTHGVNSEGRVSHMQVDDLVRTVKNYQRTTRG